MEAYTARYIGIRSRWLTETALNFCFSEHLYPIRCVNLLG